MEAVATNTPEWTPPPLDTGGGLAPPATEADGAWLAFDAVDFDRVLERGQPLLASSGMVQSPPDLTLCPPPRGAELL